MNIENVIISEVWEAYSVFSPKGRYEKMQNRRCYGLSLCIDGKITYIQNGCEYVSDSSSAIILPKGGNYFIRGDKTGNFPVINFECVGFLCDTVTAIPIRNTEELLSDYEKIKKLFCFDGNRARIMSIFYEMIHKISASGIPELIRGAMRLINGGYTDPTLTNARLAKECNVSEVYFRKLFTKHLKTSPKQYIIDVRLQKAKQYLTEGVFSISEISEKCGFSNPYHFCRIFKEHLGITPSEYRKENLIYRI